MKRIVLFLGDLVVLYASLYITLFIRYGLVFRDQISIHLIPFSLLFILWLIIFYIASLYELNLSKNSPEFYSSLFTSIALSTAISVLFFYLIPNIQIAPRRNLLIYVVILTGLISLWRWLYNKILGQTFKNNTIIVGFNQLAYDLAKFLNRNPQYGYNLKYALDISEQAAFSFQNIDFKQVRGAKDIQKIIEEEKINTIILSPESYRLPDIIDVFYKVGKRNVYFINLASAYEKIMKKIPLETLNQLWFLENISRGEKKLYEFIKRFLDITLAIIGGIIFIVLFPFIALAIKRIKGPVFYKQTRIGKGGQPFEVIKFRTMVENAEPNGAVWAEKNDSRVTKIGKFLRKTRIDELPQIINILKGEMSVVGPRAERPEFVEKLKNQIPFYEERLLVRPGLSGWAQINYGKDLDHNDTKEKLQYDLYYIKNKSLTVDLAVILKTIKTVLSATGW
ncbi:MAG: sugar transferase [Patescibacteria group bacterium]